MPTVRPILTRSVISKKNSFISQVEYDPISVKIEEDPYILKSINQKASHNTFIKEDLGAVKINEVLPFRVKFYNVGITTTQSVAPIGIAIIGFNNYIL